MYNWSLLLLAFFAVFQPIASFTERNLVDGRQQCCDHRHSRDSKYSLYGENRYKSETRRINDQRREIREIRRDERRDENIRLSPPTIETVQVFSRVRQNRELPEFRTHFSQVEHQRERESRREVHSRLTTPDQRERNHRAKEPSTDRILNADIRLDNLFRNIRTVEGIIFRTRDVDESLDKRNVRRSAVDSRRENRLIHDKVDDVFRAREHRDTRDELRRNRDNIERTDMSRAMETQRIQHERSIDQGRLASATRYALRNEHSARSLDRLSRRSYDNRRISIDNFRNVNLERDSRDVRNIEMRARERSEVDLEVHSRFLTPTLTDNRDRRSFIDSTRTINDLRVYQINLERMNDDGNRRERRIARERNDYERRSTNAQFEMRTPINAARERTDERVTSQRRNIQEDTRDNTRDSFRRVNLKDVRTRITERRLSQSESRVLDNHLARQSLNLRGKITNENRRTFGERMFERIQSERQGVRETSRNFDQREISQRTQIRFDEKRLLDNRRESRKQTFERRSVDERIRSEERDSREVQRRVTEIRNIRSRDNERRFRVKSENRMSRGIDVRRDSTRAALVTDERRNFDSRSKLNADFSRSRINAIGNKRSQNNDTEYENNWSNLIYTLQAIYLCTIFIPMIVNNNDKKKSKSLGLWTPLQKLVKTD